MPQTTYLDIGVRLKGGEGRREFGPSSEIFHLCPCQRQGCHSFVTLKFKAFFRTFSKYGLYFQGHCNLKH